MFKKLIVPAVIISSSCFASSDLKENNDDLMTGIVSICRENSVRQKKKMARPSKTHYGSAIQPYAEVLGYLAGLDVPSVRMLPFGVRSKENARSVKSDSQRFNISESFLPFAAVEGDTFDFLDLEKGVVIRMALIPGIGDDDNSTQNYYSWNSLKDWLESQAKTAS